jgi:phosphate transport system substrate-binding protein
MPITLFILGLSFALISLILFSQQRKNAAFIGLILSIVSISLAYWSRPEQEFISKPVKTIRIYGSKTLGRSLMPKLMSKYLLKNNYTIIEREEHLDFLRITGRHTEKEEDLAIEIVAKGSLYGFEQLTKDQCQLAMASSRIDEQTIEQLGRKFKLHQHEHIIAYDAVQLIVHPKMAKHISALNSLRLNDILTGRIAEWSELSGEAKGPIHCYLRDEQSGTFHYLEELFLHSSTLRADAIQLPYFEQIAAAVAKDSLGLGFINYAIDDRLLSDIRILGIKNQEGSDIAASYPNIISGQYPLARPLYLYTNSLHDKDPIIQSIIKFCRAADASDIVHEEGLVPLAEAVL